jgi:anti-sigma B factor antagonist
MALQFKISNQDNTHVISMSGSITSDADLEVLRADADSLSRIIFDFSELSHTNSTGINFMIRTLTKSRVNGGDLVIVGISGNVKKLFELAKIDGLFTVRPTIEEAIEYFKS